MGKKDIQDQLQALSADFSALRTPFTYFYCPILHRDERVPLCRGHVETQAFANASHEWVVQRADVDNFFGAYFESEFALLEDRGATIADTLEDRSLARRLRPQIFVDGEEVGHYIPDGAVPSGHTEITMTMNPSAPGSRVAIKMTPTEMLTAKDGAWEIGFARDLRLASLVSLLKVAHLTLFKLHGYRYVLSGGGHFLGHTILGTFVAANLHKSKSEILTSAKEHFSPFSTIVRPLQSFSRDLKGTLNDREVLICWSGAGPWGVIVFVRAGNTMHAVIVPVFQLPDSAVVFHAFQQQPFSRIEVRRAIIHPDHWEIGTTGTTLPWPDGRFDDAPV